YWPGCRSLSRFPERIGAEMQLLRTLGAEHISLPGRDDVPTCCGGVLRTMGDKGGLQASAAGLQQYFNRQRTWVTPCSSCLQTVRQGYPSVGIEINAEVLHLGQYLLFFLDRLAELGRETMEAREAADSPTPTILVHSSCGLHRRLGREEPIARIIAAVTGQVPDALPPGPDKSPCCGAGDFHDLRRPTAAAQVADWSFRTARPARGTWVVTTDITCVGALQLGLPDEVRTFDLVGFLLEWLGPVL
ncbi:MAG: (Fe-S)-binding protein, partial [Myxococcota bacterium]|nr:(Fe-S)-binding protein [Myxococcota bacterium]